MTNSANPGLQVSAISWKTFYAWFGMIIPSKLDMIFPQQNLDFVYIRFFFFFFCWGDSFLKLMPKKTRSPLNHVRLTRLNTKTLKSGQIFCKQLTGGKRKLTIKLQEGTNGWLSARSKNIKYFCLVLRY